MSAFHIKQREVLIIYATIHQRIKRVIFYSNERGKVSFPSHKEGRVVVINAKWAPLNSCKDKEVMTEKTLSSSYLLNKSLPKDVEVLTLKNILETKRCRFTWIRFTRRKAYRKLHHLSEELFAKEIQMEWKKRASPDRQLTINGFYSFFDFPSKMKWELRCRFAHTSPSLTNWY